MRAQRSRSAARAARRGLRWLASLAVAVGCASGPGAIAARVARPAPPGPGACPRGVLPAYAHNDYANPRPLVDALALGYRGAEADVALVDGTLRLGHDGREARRGASLEATYLAPLAALVARCGTLTADGAPFLLAVELKARDGAASDSVDALLARWAPRLAGASGARGAPAVEVVLVGWHAAPATRGAIGVHHRLRRPEEVTTLAALPARVRLVSVDHGRTLGRPWRTAAGRRRWLAALEAARRALDVAAVSGAPRARLRVHALPVDAAEYRALLAAGVDLIGTKDLVGTARALGAMEGAAGPP